MKRLRPLDVGQLLRIRSITSLQFCQIVDEARRKRLEDVRNTLCYHLVGLSLPAQHSRVLPTVTGTAALNCVYT